MSKKHLRGGGAAAGALILRAGGAAPSLLWRQSSTQYCQPHIGARSLCVEFVAERASVNADDDYAKEMFPREHRLFTTAVVVTPPLEKIC